MTDVQKMNKTEQQDFEQAMGESFGEFVCPPIPWEDASAHECCEAIWKALGRDVTPSSLAKIEKEKVEDISRAFGAYFECTNPPIEKIEEAIGLTLKRWPVS